MIMKQANKLNNLPSYLFVRIDKIKGRGELRAKGVGFVDLGGGLGIPYHRKENPDKAPTPEEYAATVMPVFVEACKKNNISPAFGIEPGVRMVGESPVLLTKVNSDEHVHKNFANVDVGFNILIPPAKYDSFHEVMVVNKADAADTETYTVTSPICETRDLIAADCRLPEIAAKDIVAVLDAGAYGYAMASEYNAHLRCAEVLVNNGRVELMRRVETYEDMTIAVMTPSWHKK